MGNIEIITNNFYLTGRTALAEFYLHHRYSEDLDFFSETEFEIQGVLSALKGIQKEAEIKKFDWHIDYLQLGSQFLKAVEVKDYPKMTVKIKLKGN